MGRKYAGILGPLACGMILARGLLHGGGFEATLLAASGGLFLFALLGYVAGQLADQFVRESVRTQFQAALADWEAKHAQPGTT
ncbi:MAG: hypothetical protein WD872_20485 [Pirellulaceae bacterium]